MSQHEKTGAYEDEINLYDYYKVVAKRKKLIIGLFIVSVILAAVVSYFIMPKIYRGEVIVRLPAIGAKEFVSIMGRLDEERLKGILPETHNLVADIKLNVLRDSANKLQVIIDAKNTDAIPAAVSELMDHINNNPLIKRHVEQEKERLLKQSSELSKVIENSEKLLKTYESLLIAGRLTTVGFNPIDLGKRVSDLKIEKLIVEQAINNLKGIEIIRQHISEDPVKPNVKMNIALAGIISLFAGIFLAFFVEYISKIKGSQKS